MVSGGVSPVLVVKHNQNQEKTGKYGSGKCQKNWKFHELLEADFRHPPGHFLQKTSFSEAFVLKQFFSVWLPIFPMAFNMFTSKYKQKTHGFSVIMNN